MSVYKAPDGSKYNIPSDPLQRKRFVDAVKIKYKEDLDETSTLGQAKEFLKAIPRGAASLALDVPTGIVSLFDIGDDSEALKGLRGLEQSLREDSALAADPRYADKFSTKLGEGIGSFVPFLGAAKAGSLLSKAGAVSQKAGQYGVPAALAIPTGMSAQADRLNMAREMGEDVGGLTETTATLLGGAIGITEILPVAHIFSKISKAAPPSTKEKLISALKSWAFEGGQEVTASILQDLTARGLYSEELPIGESLFDEFTIGGIIGAGADLVVTSMGKKGIKDFHAQEKARRETLNKEALMNAKKVELGIQQGTIQEYQEPVQVNIPNIPPPDFIQEIINLDYVENADGTYSILNLNNPSNPVMATAPSQAEAVIGIDKLKTAENNKLLKSQLDNMLYLQGNVNSSAAFEIGQTLLDPIATTVGANDIAAYNSRLKDKGKKNFVDQNKDKTFTMKEAKGLLTKKDFNTMTESMAQAVFKQSEKSGEPSLTAGKQKLNTTPKFLKSMLASKNIKEDSLVSPAFRHAAEVFTGSGVIADMSKGQKELLLARIHAMPKFNNKIEMPNFKPREYIAQDMADFVASVGKSDFTMLDIENFLTQRYTGKKAKYNEGNFEDNSYLAIQEADAFERDLLASGRAELKDDMITMNIRDNFEFDIARRTESFGQTPEEFRAKLEAENKLPPEIIDQLVESERVKQEKVLPPEEIEPKFLNYAEAIEEGRTNKFAKEAQRILKERGLGDTGVIISDELLSASTLRQIKDNEVIYDPRQVKDRGVEGEYDKQSDIIFLSLNRINPDGNLSEIEIQQKLNRVLDHEMVHALRAKDLINEKEYNYLRNQVKSKKVPASFDDKFKNKTFYQRSVDINTPTLAGRELTEEKREEFFVEEAIAEMFKAKEDIKNVPPKVDGIFNKVIDFFKGMGEAMRLSGYKNVSDIFTDIESGRVGARTRGEIRTTRELDTGPIDRGLGDLADDIRIREEALEEPTRVVAGDPIITTQELQNLKGISIPNPPHVEPKPKPKDPKKTPEPTEIEIEDIPPLNEVYDTTKLTPTEYKENREYIINGLVNSKAISKAGSNRQPNLYVGDSVEMMKWLKDNSPTEEYRILAAKTYETLVKLKKKGFEFPLEFTNSQIRGELTTAGAVSYRSFGTPTKFQMYIMNSPDSVKAIDSRHLPFRQSYNGVNYSTILHEAMHAATQSNLESYKMMVEGRRLPEAARAPVKLNKKSIKAIEDLGKVQDKVVEYIEEKTSYYRKLGNELLVLQRTEALDSNEFQEAFDKYVETVSVEPQIIQDLAASLVDANLPTNQRHFNNIQRYEGWKRHYFDYMITGKAKGKGSKDLSEFITHGFTDREFQKLLEAIPYKTKKAWSSFVEAIRNLLNLPAKSNTALSAFLQYAEPAITTGAETTALGKGFKGEGTRKFAEVTKEFDQVTLESEGVVSEGSIDDFNFRIKPLSVDKEGFVKYRVDILNNGEGQYAIRDTTINDEGPLANTFIIYADEGANLGTRTDSVVQALKSDLNDLYKGNIISTQHPDPNIEGVRLQIPELSRMADLSLDEKLIDVSDKENLRTKLRDLQTQLYDAERLEADGRGRVGPTTAKKDRNRVNRIQNEIDFIEQQLAKPVEPEQMELFQEGVRFEGEADTSEKIKLQKSVEEVEELVRQTPRGGVPYYSLNASDTAIDAALEFNKDLSSKSPSDIPLWSAPSLDGVDADLVEGIERTGGKGRPVEKSWGARMIEVAKDPIKSISNYFGKFRENFVDKLDAIDKAIVRAISENEEVRQANNTADTATMAALRLADRARGLFQQMLTKGTINSRIEGEDSLANVIKGEDGGLIEILSPLYSRPELDLERIFKFYGSLKRTETFDKNGRLVASPITEADLALIDKIETQYPEVKDVFDAYQRWNNELITFAEEKGLLSKFKSNNQIIEELIEKLDKGEITIDPEQIKNLIALSEANNGLSVEEIVRVGNQYGIDTRGQAEIWRQQSSYYPFYRDMVDDSGIKAPVIAGGALPNNPLSIKLEGSEDILDVNPLEAITRNSLSILTASLKNDGLSKLIRDLEIVGEARPISAENAGKVDSIFVFREGIKYHYQVDRNLVEGIQGIGGVGTGPIQKALALPASLLRDTVTRDPGFVVVNILRDTLSSAVTSGADFVPVKDSIVNMFRDMEDLEQFGVLGGYDFSNDEGSIKQYVDRTMRQQGLTPSNGMSAKNAFFKLWDGLGALTTKSDGATRLAVYDAVYKKLKDQGYTEAQAQSEAAYQGLEIINFGRRGQDPLFRVITSAIPFLNARIQGLDVLYRSASGKYSAVEKLQENETLQDVQARIFRKALLNSSLLTSITLLYYLMVHDTDEYRNLKREVRDDNWVVPTPFDYSLKIPIPFEVGMLFKAIPERVFDLTLGDDAFSQKSVDELLTSTGRQLETSLNLPFIQPGGGFQIIKPLAEAINNRNSYTGQDIVPYYQLKREPAYQTRASTNQLAKEIGELFNISPAKIEHVLRGYTGTLGGYVLALSDTLTRGATGEPLLPNNVNLAKQLPVVNRLLLDTEKAGGLQQQFYELRGEVDRAVATINSLKNDKRFDELSAYRSNMKGVIGVKGQIRALERYLDNWRKRRDRLMRNENISVIAKSDKLREMELERDRRLAFVPELRKKANIPVFSLNL